MSAQIIDGRAIAQHRRRTVKEQIEERLRNGMRAPGLAVVLVGEDHASQVYVRNKRRACDEAGLVLSSGPAPSILVDGSLFIVATMLLRQALYHKIQHEMPLTRPFFNTIM